MTGWQDSHSTDQKHEHNLITDSKGQEVCSSCHQIVIKPITSIDDPRLTEAGFMRSPHHEQSTLHDLMPLPELLIGMYNETRGEFPVAPYLCIISDELWKNGAPYEDMWIDLSRKTQS